MRCLSSLLQHETTASTDPTKLTAIVRSVERLVAPASTVEELKRITTAVGRVPQDPDNRIELQRPPFQRGVYKSATSGLANVYRSVTSELAHIARVRLGAYERVADSCGGSHDQLC